MIYREPDDLVADGKRAFDDLLGLVEEARSECEEHRKESVNFENQLDDTKAMLAEATEEIERLKKMAFEEIVRETTEERMK